MNVPKVKLLFEILISHSFEPFRAGYKIIIEVACKLSKYAIFLVISGATIEADLSCPKFSYRALIQIADNNADNGSGDGICELQSPMYCAR